MSRVAEALCTGMYEEENTRAREDGICSQRNCDATNIEETKHEQRGLECWPTKTGAWKPNIKVSQKPLTMQQYVWFLKKTYPGLDIGRQRLFRWFRQEGIMGGNARIPDWAYIRDGLFMVKWVKTTSPQVYEPVAMISPKGQLMFTGAIVKSLTTRGKKSA